MEVERGLSYWMRSNAIGGQSDQVLGNLTAIHDMDQAQRHLKNEKKNRKSTETANTGMDTLPLLLKPLI